MEKELFNPMEIDAIGEMMNISLGSSATAVSNMLDHRVDITTPTVSVVAVKDFTIGKLEPAMGVEIKYVEGLEGSNIMLLRKSDIKVIVDILMGTETPEEEFELDDLTISAVCEVMNQMMGAAATALSDFLGYPVNISTPEPFELEDLDEFKRMHLPQGVEDVVVVRFALKIENALESEFMNVMSVSLAKELLHGLGLGDEDEEEAPPPAGSRTRACPRARRGQRRRTEALTGGDRGADGGEYGWWRRRTRSRTGARSRCGKRRRQTAFTGGDRSTDGGKRRRRARCGAGSCPCCRAGSGRRAAAAGTACRGGDAAAASRGGAHAGGDASRRLYGVSTAHVLSQLPLSLRLSATGDAYAA